MKKVYSVIQSMSSGNLRVNEWDIVKETKKLVTYSSMYNYQKNKDNFDKVHLNCKSESTGLFQDAYVLVFAETEAEAVQKAVSIFQEWLNSLQQGLNQSLEEQEKKEEKKQEWEEDEEEKELE